MRKMKVAVIGCGMIAKSQHIKAYAQNEHAEIKYLVDIRRERAVELAGEYKVPFTETDYKAILEDEEVEAVSICTPNDSHAEIAIACLNAGKHVLCEKPASVNMDLVREMKAAADRNDRILSIGVVNRFNTAVNKIKDMIEAGELGSIYHVYCSFRSHRSIPGLGGPFTTKAKAGGGVLIDWGVHFLDLILYCLNQPDILTVSGTVHSELGKDMKNYTYLDMWAGPPDYSGTYDVEDFVTGLIRTSGPTLSLNGAWAQNINESAMFIEFLGDKAGVKLQYGGDFKVYSAKNGMLSETSHSFAKTDMFHDEIDDFLKSASANTKNRASIDHVIQTSQVMEALYQSSELGKEVSL
ncbi:Gfo/Idh/MocA family protein [Paenibacillus nasutitermitis]|uniref:Oxidoreductase n=1 Tax=Paenibacillus nasutitermitis TaxID=1652958 RepID=A0A916Z487_9BACL|nr:Gfo/Idh/MocA family oxidoreductase [Paenibacillus nasutitermitis]GGD75665.1 oxidoreductase [Paenibacillus nasutitermitis]